MGRARTTKTKEGKVLIMVGETTVLIMVGEMRTLGMMEVAKVEMVDGVTITVPMIMTITHHQNNMT